MEPVTVHDRPEAKMLPRALAAMERISGGLLEPWERWYWEDNYSHSTKVIHNFFDQINSFVQIQSGWQNDSKRSL